MIQRDVAKKVISYATKFPAIAILGPRQSGKTTLAKQLFPHYRYVSLEDFTIRLLATQDPKQFLQSIQNEHGVILDEVQNVPTLLSYMQGIIDESEKAGYFIVTGSHNILLNEAISQTLAGRIAIVTLLPLALSELVEQKLVPNTLESILFTGMYPRLYASALTAPEWYPSYIQTYIERDVRQIQQLFDVTLFQRFLKLCAARVGQLINITSLANDCGITFVTARGWLSLLEMSYIIFLLQPYYKNFNKRLTKSPKLYFYDTGILCSLLDIKQEEQLQFHHLRGSIFESFVISELAKSFYNKIERPTLYFWRDHHGTEIDCLIELGTVVIPIEIKSGVTFNNDFFHTLSKWDKITQTQGKKYVVYAGDQRWDMTKGILLPWRELTDIIP
jgi:uncharacterized protein